MLSRFGVGGVGRVQVNFDASAMSAWQDPWHSIRLKLQVFAQQSIWKMLSTNTFKLSSL